METTSVTTPVDGWNPVTLMAHLIALIAEHDRRYQQRFDDQETAVEAATGTISALLDERDRRYQERFDATSRELHEHLAQVKTETQAAQFAAERAVAVAAQASEKAIEKQERQTEMAISKQEIATEKRFEGVNEFRAQQADIITTFARKTEIDARLTAITDKLETAVAQINANLVALDRRTSDSFSAIGSRLDLLKGSSMGQQEQRTESRAQISSANAVLGLIIAVVTIVGFIVAANALTGK